MGLGIAGHYTLAEDLFTTSFWKVSLARHKISGELVSLWQMDYDTVLKTGSKSERQSFLEASLQAIQQMRRLRHPSVLKILEPPESIRALSFAAEPVMNCLAYEHSFSPDDASYIALQLANVLAFLHRKARIVVFGLSTFSLCLTESLALKVCLLTHAVPAVHGRAEPKLGPFSVSPFHPLLNFSSIEYVMNRPVGYSSDVFSFGCVLASVVLNRCAFDYAMVDEYVREVVKPLVFDDNVSVELRELISACMARDPARRPRFDQILQSPVFHCTPLSALQYLDVLVTKTEEDKYTFFKGFAATLPSFSLRLLQWKMVPLLISEVTTQPRLGPVVLPLLFEIARSFDKYTFFTLVFTPLAPVLANPDPPQCLLAVLASLPIIIDQIEEGRHYELCYPIMAAALSSTVSQLHREALSHIPKLLDRMTTETVDREVVPALIDLFSKSNDVKVVSACVQSLADCLPKLDHDSFSQRVVPRITAAWNRLGEPAALADACLYVVERLHASVQVAMREVVPMVSEVLASDASPPPTQRKLCEYIKQKTAELVAPKVGRSPPNGGVVVRPPRVRTPAPVREPMESQRIRAATFPADGEGAPRPWNTIPMK
jgi:serine/threonine protein kinase